MKSWRGMVARYPEMMADSREKSGFIFDSRDVIAESVCGRSGWLNGEST